MDRGPLLVQIPLHLTDVVLLHLFSSVQLCYIIPYLKNSTDEKKPTKLLNVFSLEEDI